MKFVKSEFESFKKDVTNALQDIASNYGVKINCGKITYGNYDFTMQLEVVKNDKNINGEKMAFEQHCSYYGFFPEDYKREFSLDGKKFKFIGFNIKSPKNCCRILCVSDNREYKCSAETVKRAFLHK